MTIYQHYIKGDLDLCIKLNVVKSSVVEYCKIYSIFQQHKSRGNTYLTSIVLTAEDMNLTTAKVRVAVATVG